MTTQREEAQPLDGVTGLLDLFDRFPLVVLWLDHLAPDSFRSVRAIWS